MGQGWIWPIETKQRPSLIIIKALSPRGFGDKTSIVESPAKLLLQEGLMTTQPMDEQSGGSAGRGDKAVGPCPRFEDIRGTGVVCNELDMVRAHSIAIAGQTQLVGGGGRNCVYLVGSNALYMLQEELEGLKKLQEWVDSLVRQAMLNKVNGVGSLHSCPSSGPRSTIHKGQVGLGNQGLFKPNHVGVVLTRISFKVGRVSVSGP